MPLWKRLLYGYTTVYILLAVWTPQFWFMSWAMQMYRQDTFELFSLPLPVMIFGILVLLGCFAATLGLIIANPRTNEE